jgi:hypothetical protein
MLSRKLLLDGKKFFAATDEMPDWLQPSSLFGGNSLVAWNFCRPLRHPACTVRVYLFKLKDIKHKRAHKRPCGKQQNFPFSFLKSTSWISFNPPPHSLFSNAKLLSARETSKVSWEVLLTHEDGSVTCGSLSHLQGWMFRKFLDELVNTPGMSGANKSLQCLNFIQK